MENQRKGRKERDKDGRMPRQKEESNKKKTTKKETKVQSEEKGTTVSRYAGLCFPSSLCAKLS